MRRSASGSGCCREITRRTTIFASSARATASWIFIAACCQTSSTPWAGLGYSNVTPFKTPGEYSEEEIAEALAAFDGIAGLHLVVHFPPQGTRLDEYAPGQHAGSPALRAWVEREQPPFLFCGHIHETAGLSDRLGSTLCINVGKEGYAVEI